MHCVPFCLLAVSWNSFFPSCLIPPFPEVVAEMPLLFYFLATPSDMWDLSSMTRHQTGAPCVETHSFDHWTAREVPVPPPEGSLPHPSEAGWVYLLWFPTASCHLLVFSAGSDGLIAHLFSGLWGPNGKRPCLSCLQPGTQQLSRKCWHVNNEGTLPSAGCPHLLHQLTGWWFWLLESLCYPKRKNFAPNSKAKELPSPEEDLSFWTPELLHFWVLTLSMNPPSPQPCQQYPHSLFSLGQ